MKNKDSSQEFRNAFVGSAGETYLKKTKWKAELHDKFADVPRLRNQLVKEYLNKTVTFEAYCQIAQQMALDQERTFTLRTKKPEPTDQNRNPNIKPRGGSNNHKDSSRGRGGSQPGGRSRGVIGHH